MERRLGRGLAVGALLVSITGGVLMSSAAVAQASTSITLSTPSQVQGSALEVVQSVRDAGPLTVDTAMSAAGGSTFTDSGGATVDVSQSSLVAQDDGGTVLVGIAVLGGEQLVVQLTNLSGGDTTTVVTDPGTTTVESTYGPVRPASSRRLTPAGASGAASLGASPDANSCYYAFEVPDVISSIYGPLIDGYGAISCNYAANPALIVGLQEYENGDVGIGNGAVGSGTYSAGANAYAPCTSGGGNYFRTIILYNFNGGGLTGWDSGWTVLECALD